MLEIDGAMTIELKKNGKTIESYSSLNKENIIDMAIQFTKKMRPKFLNTGIANERYEIHFMTF